MSFRVARENLQNHLPSYKEQDSWTVQFAILKTVCYRKPTEDSSVPRLALTLHPLQGYSYVTESLRSDSTEYLNICTYIRTYY